MIATKAARIVEAAAGRPWSSSVRGARTRRKPGCLAARAAYIGGCAGTSNTLAGFRYGIPVFGTAAHSWVMAFCGETKAFRQLQKRARRAHRPTDRHLRHARRRAQGGAAGPAALGRPARSAATS